MPLNLIISENQFYINQFQVKDYFFKVLFPQNQFQYQYLHQTGFDQRSRTTGSSLQMGFLRALGPDGGVCRRLLPLCLVGDRSWEGKSDMSRENRGQTGSPEEEINPQGQTNLHLSLTTSNLEDTADLQKPGLFSWSCTCAWPLTQRS